MLLRQVSINCKACPHLPRETETALLQEIHREEADILGQTLQNVGTPCLILDQDRMDRNVARLRARLDQLGVALRPHLKTSKSVDAARRVMTTAAGPATVSTLKEAEQFARAGVTDLIY